MASRWGNYRCRTFQYIVTYVDIIIVIPHILLCAFPSVTNGIRLTIKASLVRFKLAIMPFILTNLTNDLAVWLWRAVRCWSLSGFKELKETSTLWKAQWVRQMKKTQE